MYTANIVVNFVNKLKLKHKLLQNFEDIININVSD